MFSLSLYIYIMSIVILVLSLIKRSLVAARGRRFPAGTAPRKILMTCHALYFLFACSL
ncbi:hypothetical protein HanIR_Chr01g0006381 [Helianthus annuus]|nr:hypothetical protein HanIR_Chr01g0006381 [Helianthus annuus]